MSHFIKQHIISMILIFTLSACSFDSDFHSREFRDEMVKLQSMGIKKVEFSSSAMFTPSMINQMSETVYVTTNKGSFSTRLAGAPYLLDGLKIETAKGIVSMRERNKEVDAETVSWMIKKGLETVHEELEHSQAVSESWKQ